MRTVTMDQALDLLRKARDDYGPDYRDPAAVTNAARYATGDHDDTVPCEYRYPGGKMCIAGWILHELGVPLDGREQEWEGFATVAQQELADLGYSFEPNAVEVVCTAQGRQDDAKTWGEAVTEAEHRADELTRKRAYT